MIYGQFADFYDELFDPAMYDSWLGFVRSQGVVKTDSVLDLACGTGRLAIKMIQSGYQVAGLDLAPEMLSIAASKAQAAGVELPLIQGDMTALGDLGLYNTITCFDDSLCYLPNEDEMAEGFREAAAHLTDNGHYLFDVITPHQTDDVYPGYMYNFHDDHRAFMWTSYEGDAEHQVEHDLNFFIWNESIKGYDHHAELHVERTYPLATYRRLLTQAGFDQIQVFADFGKAEPDADTTRWFFDCRREG